MLPLNPLKFRSRTTVAAAVIGTAALVSTGVGVAAAGTTTSTPPGDNGTVKIHRSATPADDPRNEPKVCEFYLVGFHFDPGQEVSWRIKSWPPTGDKTQVLDGVLTLDGNGHGRTDDLILPNGHYKLFWNFAGEKGAGKHKVFWVKCKKQRPTPTPTPTGEPTPTPTDEPSPTPTASDEPTPPDDEAPKPKPVEKDFDVTG